MGAKVTINSSSIPALRVARIVKRRKRAEGGPVYDAMGNAAMPDLERTEPEAYPDRKSTRLNSSH